MKIVFTTKGNEMDSMMDPRFGRAECLIMYDDETKQHIAFDNTESGNAAHAIITGNGPGDKATSTLKVADIKVYVGAGNMKVSEALQAFQNGKLVKLDL